MKINPNMLTIARESRGLVHQDVANALKMDNATSWRYEKGTVEITKETIQRLASFYGYPESFFFQKGGLLPMALSYRKRNKVSPKIITRIEASINIARLNIESILSAVKFTPEVTPLFDVNKYGSPENCAKALRKTWDIEKGPIGNLASLMEERKILLLNLDFETERVDGMFMMAGENVPVIVTNSHLLGDRQRFTLAFELGHLVMHLYTSPGFERDLSHEANLFAAELLMPAKEVSKDLEDLSLPKLGQLKKKWGVSMQALLYRASDLELITENQKNYLLKQFNQQNIRRREPQELDIKRENYKLVRDLITSFRTKQKYSVDQMAGFFHLKTEDFLNRYTN